MRFFVRLVHAYIGISRMEDQTRDGPASLRSVSDRQPSECSCARRYNAPRTEGDGEISRDEVPVAVQAYGQRYFEQVRKHALGPVGVKPPEAPVRRKGEPPKTLG